MGERREEPFQQTTRDPLEFRGIWTWSFQPVPSLSRVPWLAKFLWPQETLLSAQSCPSTSGSWDPQGNPLQPGHGILAPSGAPPPSDAEVSLVLLPQWQEGRLGTSEDHRVSSAFTLIIP